MINKKNGEAYPWLAFIPVIQIYSFVKAAGKSAIWILWLILGFICFLIPGLILSVFLIHNISQRTGHGEGIALLMIFFGPIVFPIVGYNYQGSLPAKKV
ncbi:hypothetical protein KAZ01_02960 [Candidatus Gracilibacteria bacterium]|nr:hypothetical protein [Candidatus Gracilibacteria bacterium]